MFNDTYLNQEKCLFYREQQLNQAFKPTQSNFDRCGISILFPTSERGVFYRIGSGFFMYQSLLSKNRK